MSGFAHAPSRPGRKSSSRGTLRVEAAIEGNRLLTVGELAPCWARLEAVSFTDPQVALDVLEDEVEAAAEAVTEAYLDAGFAAVQQAEPRLELSADQRRLRVTFVVREGERHRIGRVQIRSPIGAAAEPSRSGEHVLPDSLDAGIPGVREGDPYCRRTLEAGLARLRERWELRAGRRVGVALEVIANPRDARLDLRVIGRPVGDEPRSLRP